MGFFSFIKKDKGKQLSAPENIELPPLPDMNSLPPLPEGGPELPTPPDMEEPIPEEPAEEKTPPVVETPEEMAPEEANMFPEIPLEEPVEEIPEKIPSLEEIPEAPPEMPEIETPEPTIEEPNIEEPVPSKIPRLEGLEPVPYKEPYEFKLHREARGPIFVKVDMYKEILDDVAGMKQSLKNDENIYARIMDLKTEEDKRFEHIHRTFEDIQRKLMYVDRMLFEG